ncbi:MAG: alpha/beta fold hydrolase [Anaerolineae bacterium]|nr:alpha/beta fold hydrolase [Anaerolineae bacterium]
MKGHHMPVFQNPQLEGKSIYWPGNATGVLLIHGFTATTAEVRLLADAFKKQGLTVSAPLLPGHGTSPQDMNCQHYTDWIACVESAYKKLRETCSKVIAGGESMGAVLTLYLASEHVELDALLIYSPAIRVDNLKYASILKYLFPILEKSNNDPDDTSWQGYTVNPLYAADELRKLQREVIGRLSVIKQPALILQGIYDKTIHPESGRMIYDGIQSTIKHLEIMRESGHVMLLGKESDHIIGTTMGFLKSADIL